MNQTKKPRKATGQELGLSLGRCLATDRVYSREMTGPLPYLYFIPLALAWLICDLTLRFHYRNAGAVDWTFLPANLFTLGWTLLMVGLVFALPGKWKWFFRCVPLMFCMANMETHSGFYNFFGRFFSLTSLTFVGDGQFASRNYIHIDGFILAGAITTIVLMMFSGRLLHVIPPRTRKQTVLGGLGAMVLGAAIVIGTQIYVFSEEDAGLWDPDRAVSDQSAYLYSSFADSTNCCMLHGLYQYTAQDIWAFLRPDSRLSARDRQRVESYIQSYESRQQPNEYSGSLAGKNLLLIQLEAMDPWLIDPDYTPTLYRLRQEGLTFVNHYTPSFVPAATFNTEIMVNTSVLPVTENGVSTAVYREHAFPYSLARLFTRAGYHANSFHASEGDVYHRGAYHPNLGYEHYYSGSDMAMEQPQMDRYLINGFEEMTGQEPFFSFVITYSIHGPYIHNPVFEANGAAAAEADKIRRGNTAFAIAGAMETDRFVTELLERLEESGHLEDTVLGFYADHMNIYLQDEELEMEMQGVDNRNLILHTDFFLWSPSLEARQVEKVTTSLDILPTLANLFGLDTRGAFLAGHDALGEEGGYVFFNDGSWYDGSTYWDSSSRAEGDPARSREIAALRALSNMVMVGNYYGDSYGDSP